MKIKHHKSHKNDSAAAEVAPSSPAKVHRKRGRPPKDSATKRESHFNKNFKHLRCIALL